MFEYWLSELGGPKPSNRRMHILLKGLMRSIESGFRDDPIVIPDLARELKKQFGNKNIRYSQEPLREMLSNETIAVYLMLLDEEDERLRIDTSADLLRMRLKSRDEVRDNVDISINLAVPGRVRSVFDKHLNCIDRQFKARALIIARSIRESHAWQDE